MKEYFDQNKATGKFQRETWRLCSSLNLKLQKQRKQLLAKYHRPLIVVRFTNRAAVILRNVASGRTLKKSINVNRFKVDYVKSEVNNWDPLDIDSDEGVQDEDKIHTSSLGPPSEDTPVESGKDTQPNTTLNV